MSKTAPSHRLRPGDLICGNCGEGNVPTRRFCSRCGMTLVEAVSVKTPWWRRFVPRRGPKVVKLDGKNMSGKSAARAGSGFDFKHLLRQIYRGARIAVAVAILLGGALYGAYPPFRNAINSRVESAKSHISNDIGNNLQPIHAVTVTANAAEPNHPAFFATDELTNTYWLAPWSDSHIPTLTLTFSHRVTIKKMILHSGASDAFIADGRPSSLHLVFSNDESFTISPQDTSQAQTITIDHADLISSVEIQVSAVYPGTGGNSNVAVSEVELFGLP